jgi:hypothetical protein
VNDSYYDVAEICRNGHVITDRAATHPQHRKKFCSDCGAATIAECESCSTPIQGYYHVPGVIGFAGNPEAPTFCHECGDPYPWTSARISAAKEIALEAEDLNEEERQLLAASIDDIVRDTPATDLAATRFKRLLAKAGKGTANALHKIAVDIGSEAAKKSLGL